MTMFRSRRTMTRLFAAGTPLEPRHLLGRRDQPTEWAVRLRTGPLLDLGFLGHRARFWLDGKLVRGYHVLGKKRVWGTFKIVATKNVAAVCYDRENRFLEKRVTAELRATDYAHLVVGKLYIELLGRPRLAGYFTLRKKGDRRRAPTTRRTRS